MNSQNIFTEIFGLGDDYVVLPSCEADPIFPGDDARTLDGAGEISGADHHTVSQLLVELIARGVDVHGFFNRDRSRFIKAVVKLSSDVVQSQRRETFKHRYLLDSHNRELAVRIYDELPIADKLLARVLASFKFTKSQASKRKGRLTFFGTELPLDLRGRRNARLCEKPHSLNEWFWRERRELRDAVAQAIVAPHEHRGACNTQVAYEMADVLFTAGAYLSIYDSSEVAHSCVQSLESALRAIGSRLTAGQCMLIFADKWAARGNPVDFRSLSVAVPLEILLKLYFLKVH